MFGLLSFDGTAHASRIVERRVFSCDPDRERRGGAAANRKLLAAEAAKRLVGRSEVERKVPHHLPHLKVSRDKSDV